MAKKSVKILLVVVCTAAIALAAWQLLGINNKKATVPLGIDEDLLASWSSGDIDGEGYSFNLEVYNSQVFVELLEPNNNGRNGFYPIDNLTNCKYSSDAISWGFAYGEKKDYYGSIAPDDCQGAMIDGAFYESQTIHLEYQNRSHSIRAIVAAVPKMPKKDEHEVALIDKKGAKHLEKLNNPFD